MAKAKKVPKCPRCGSNKNVRYKSGDDAGPREAEFICTENHARGWLLGGGDQNRYWFFSIK
jgi:hypothetical protein